MYVTADLENKDSGGGVVKTRERCHLNYVFTGEEDVFVCVFKCRKMENSFKIAT